MLARRRSEYRLRRWPGRRQGFAHRGTQGGLVQACEIEAGKALAGVHLNAVERGCLGFQRVEQVSAVGDAVRGPKRISKVFAKP
jgi:hypothetical protein